MKCKRLCLLNVSVRLARKKEGDVAIYSVDVRDGMIQRVTQKCHRVNNKRFFLIEAGSAKQAWAKANSAPETNGSAVCSHAATVFVAFAKIALPQNDTRTTGYVTAAGS